MMKKFFVFAVLFSLLAAISPTSAQDATAFTCDLTSLQDAINIFSDGLEEARNETDPIKISNILQQLANGANFRRAACDGLAFSGNKQIVLGPMEFPLGLYKAHFKTTSERYVSVTITPVEGKCGQGSGALLLTSIFNVAEGIAADGIETLFSSEKCTALLEIASTGDAGDWELSFERLTS